MRDKLLVDARQRQDVGLELFWDEAKHTGCFFATAAALPSSCFAFAPVHADCGILHTSVDPALTYFHTGVVGMSDGWTDPNGRPLMNVLAATPKGSCFPSSRRIARATSRMHGSPRTCGQRAWSAWGQTTSSASSLTAPRSTTRQQGSLRRGGPPMHAIQVLICPSSLHFHWPMWLPGCRI